MAWKLDSKIIGFDTETTGLSSYSNDRIFAYSAADKEGNTTYIEDDCYDRKTWTGQYKDLAAVDSARLPRRQEIINWMADSSVVKVLHNAKFDIKMCRRFGIELKGTVHDTQIMAHVLSAQGEAGLDWDDNCLKRLSLDNLAKKYLEEDKDDGVKLWLKQNADEFVKKRGRKPNFSDVPLDIMEKYARTDSFLTVQLYHLFWPAIQGDKDFLRTYRREMELLWHVIGMEERGVQMDVPFMKQRVAELTTLEQKSLTTLRRIVPDIRIRKKKMYTRQKVRLYKWLVQKISSSEINFNSDPQMIHVLYRHFKLPILHWTKLKPGESVEGKTRASLGQPSLDERTLSRLNHPFCNELIRYRQYVKTRDTYFVGYQKHIYQGVLHPNYNQSATITGRFSSSEPNLQNIPMEEQVRERAGADTIYKGVKKAFVPRKGYLNFHFDYSGIEMRMFAHLVGTEQVKQAADYIHDWATELLYGPRNSMTPQQFEYRRVIAKIMNFGVLYGMGKKTFMWKLNKTKEEVDTLLNLYFEKLPEVRDAQQRVISQVQEQGWFKNAFGRRYLIDPRFAYKGMNYFCQGSAADVLKRAMIKVGKYLASYKSNMLMTIHDEIVCEIHESEISFIPKKIVQIMEHNPEFTVPLKVSAEVSVGNWENLKKIKNLENPCLEISSYLQSTHQR